MKIKTYNDGWEKHIGLSFPSYAYWGLLTIILMLASLKTQSNELVVLIQISSTLFLLGGIITTWKRKIIREE